MVAPAFPPFTLLRFSAALRFNGACVLQMVVAGTMDPFPATLEPSAMATGGEVLPTEGPAVFEVTCELDAQSCVHELRGGANSTKRAEDGVPMDVEYNFIAGCDRRHVGPHDSERIGEQVGGH